MSPMRTTGASRAGEAHIGNVVVAEVHPTRFLRSTRTISAEAFRPAKLSITNGIRSASCADFLGGGGAAMDAALHHDLRADRSAA